MSTLNKNNQPTFVFEKINYYLMFAGLAIIIIGFMLMAGGKSPDPNVFNDAEIFSTRRITIAPLMVILGFVIEIVAIMYQPKKK